MEKKTPKLTIADMLVARDFADVFSNDLPGVLPDRHVEFTIDLVLRAALISKASYRMAPKELQELNVQIWELMDKKFIKAQCIAVGSTGTICKEERWIT